MEKLTLHETIGLEEYEVESDGIVKNVPILGQISRNGRVYTTECMQAGFGLYENSPVFVDHSKVGRKSEEKLGLIKNARFDEDTKQVRGDLHLLTTHPLYTRVQEDITKKMGLFGLSHSAEIWGNKNDDGILEVNRIEKVASVDLVSSPATLKNLTESEEDNRADYLETVREESVALINTVINEAIEGLSASIKEKLETVIEELGKERLAKLANNRYNNASDTNNDTTNHHFTLPKDKNDARKTLLSL